MKDSLSTTAITAFRRYNLIMISLSSCFCFAGLYVLLTEKLKDARAHTIYLVVTHVIVYAMEVDIVLTNPIGHLPNVAIVVQGVWLDLPINSIIFLVLHMFLFISACILQLQCIFFRLYLICGQRTGSLKETHFHYYQLFWWPFLTPFLFLISMMNVDKSVIPIIDPNYADLIPSNVLYFNGDLNVYFRYFLGVYALYSIVFFFFVHICLYKISFALDHNHSYSQRTKDLHRKAIYSTTFMVFPQMIAISTIVLSITILFVFQLAGFDVNFPFRVMDRVVPCFFNGHSVVIGMNTLYPRVKLLVKGYYSLLFRKVHVDRSTTIQVIEKKVEVLPAKR